METIQRKILKIKNLFTCRHMISVLTVFIFIILLLKWMNHIDILGKNSTPICYNAKRNKTPNSRLVWPEDLPVADRFREQMNYVPKGYEYDKTPIKRILVHTGLGYYWEPFKLEQKEFIGCPVSQCWLTVDRSLGSEVDAVLFRREYQKPEYKRPPNQIWIMWFVEPPPNQARIETDIVGVFNWTASYRWDSDILLPYGYFMEHRPPLPPMRVDIPKTKTKKVAWFVSNCNPQSRRKEYADELAKYIDVDVYGRCGNHKCPRSDEDSCFKMLETDYKFYLSFENSHCRNYITEKLFLNALRHDVVPIVMGPGRDEYEMVAPKKSFKHVDDFASPAQLAAYLHQLDKNDHLYAEYFQWKHTGTVIPGIHNTRFYCRLCAMLHDPDFPKKNYKDVDQWWRGDGICVY